MQKARYLESKNIYVGNTIAMKYHEPMHWIVHKIKSLEIVMLDNGEFADTNINKKIKKTHLRSILRREYISEFGNSKDLDKAMDMIFDALKKATLDPKFDAIAKEILIEDDYL